ncbi:rhomboid family intramembrane serine protease [Xanthobacter dioxanivorans]|uniref:Rhomboid family intramembrane serine protease n=1 Tax=Xanthobacter dioxanivorans TaxID=2528964 RepID=A0A974PQU7_9HYPH|nr:rhomboid family intramembrane serine protease [Xanthobacter dioxanivorans]QRG08097.1 rhomboid family intramembrane serine protease [Xanthobacter dioxanivorans]
MFVPIADANPLEHVVRPYVTWALLALNVFVFVVLQHGAFGEVSEAGVLAFGAIPAVVTGEAMLPPGYERLPPALTLVSYMFLHGGWLHLIGNMAFLWVFADNVEDAMGHARFLAFYLLCGMLAGAAHILSNPSSETPLVGASGAVAGVIAAYLVLHPNIRLWALILLKIPLRVPAYWVIGAWFALQVWQILAAQDQDTAWWAHLGGFLCGALLVAVMRRPGVALFDRDPSGVPSRPAGPKGER